jgi:hypothetical protein
MRLVMRRFLIVLVVLLSAAPIAARAQGPGSPQAQEAAQDLLQIISGDMLSQMGRTMTAQVWPQLEAELGSKVDPAALAELRGEFEKILERFLVESMKDAPALYAKHFSAQELRDIAAFYKTPSGVKALQLLPTVTAEYFGTLMPRMESFQREIMTMTVQTLQKHGVRR